MTTASATIVHPREFAEDCASSTMALGVRARKCALSPKRHSVAALLLIVTLGFGLRIRGLEPNIQKVESWENLRQPFRSTGPARPRQTDWRRSPIDGNHMLFPRVEPDSWPFSKTPMSYPTAL